MKILLAVDDETFGDAIVDFVAHHEWPADTRFKLMHVIPPIIDYVSLAAVPMIMQEVREESQKTGHALVRKLAIRLRDLFHSANVEETVNEGHPAESILSEAGEWDADLIVVGSHGRRGLSKLVMGSVSAAVTGHAPCSVAVIRPQPATAQPGEKRASGVEKTAAL